MRRLPRSATFLLSLACVPASHADLVVVSETRRAATTAFAFSATDTDNEDRFAVAPPAAPFDVSLFADAALPEGGATATATQTSSLDASSVRAAGSVTGDSQVLVAGATAYGIAQSNVAVRFTLAEPAEFAVTGFLDAEGDAVLNVALSRPFETLVWVTAQDGDTALDESGVLEAGEYDLNVSCTANGTSFAVDEIGHAAAEYEVHLVLGGATDAPVLASDAPVRAAPNPFRTSTRLTVPAGTSGLRILDARGRIVRALDVASTTPVFDGRDAAGRPLPGGVYWAAPVGADGLQAREAVRLVRLR